MARPGKYQECYAFGHALERFQPHGKRAALFGDYRLSLRCVRCTTERHDVIGYGGELMTREYVWPDDYAPGRENRVAHRKVLIQQLGGKLTKTKPRGKAKLRVVA